MKSITILLIIFTFVGCSESPERETVDQKTLSKVIAMNNSKWSSPGITLEEEVVKGGEVYSNNSRAYFIKTSIKQKHNRGKMSGDDTTLGCVGLKFQEAFDSENYFEEATCFYGFGLCFASRLLDCVFDETEDSSF